jgi:methionyl-tRNA synthetase
MKLATEVNRYIDANAPWKSIKVDKEEAAKTVFTALKAIDSLKILFAPILPYTSEKLNLTMGFSEPLFAEQYIETVTDGLGEHTVLRYKRENEGINKWKVSSLKPGQRLNEPIPLIKKLDEKVVEEERERLGKTNR